MLTRIFSIIRKKFKSLQTLDGKPLSKLITFEDDDSARNDAKPPELPPVVKMVVDESAGDFIGKFLEQFFKVYDSDHREQLAMAYHEEASMSLQASFNKYADDVARSYLPDSRNLQVDSIRSNLTKRDRLLHQKRLQVVGFLDKLPKTQHDLTSFTLDVPFATKRLMTFTVTGAFRERNERPPQPIRHFSRIFTVVPQGDGLCIINDNLYVTNATREQSERSNAIFLLAEFSGMSLHWSKVCLEAQGWQLEQAKSVFETARREGKIPQEYFA